MKSLILAAIFVVSFVLIRGLLMKWFKRGEEKEDRE